VWYNLKSCRARKIHQGTVSDEKGVHGDPGLDLSVRIVWPKQISSSQVKQQCGLYRWEDAKNWWQISRQSQELAAHNTEFRKENITTEQNKVLLT
jgi:dolichyl-phosphate-mannose--protein O-mannosyl transferase